MRFDYQLHSTGLLPLCEVIILGKERRVPVRAVIDSGATHPIFPMSAAEDAGIDLQRGGNFPITFGGSQTHGRLCETYVEIVGRRFKLEIVFVERLILGYALLGRRTFFNQFNEVAFIERIRTPRVELRG
jgi:hypothetical protein